MHTFSLSAAIRALRWHAFDAAFRHTLIYAIVIHIRRMMLDVAAAFAAASVATALPRRQPWR